MFGLFKKNYNDWYSYILENEFPTIQYGHNNYSGLKFVRVICKSYKSEITLNPNDVCNKEIPTGISCKIIKEYQTGYPLIEVICPSCNNKVEFSIDSVAMGEMSERENEKNNNNNDNDE